MITNKDIENYYNSGRESDVKPITYLKIPESLRKLIRQILTQQRHFHAD